MSAYIVSTKSERAYRQALVLSSNYEDAVFMARIKHAESIGIKFVDLKDQVKMSQVQALDMPVYKDDVE